MPGIPTFDKSCEILIGSGTEVADAAAARDALMEAVAAATPAAAAWIDFDGPAPTAPALQLAAAARLSLMARDAFGGFGALAAAALGAPRQAEGERG